MGENEREKRRGNRLNGQFGEEDFIIDTGTEGEEEEGEEGMGVG